MLRSLLCAAVLAGGAQSFSPVAFAKPDAAKAETSEAVRARAAKRAKARAELLAALKAAPNERAARPIVRQLWSHWRTGPTLLAKALVMDAGAHLRAGDPTAALKILDQVTRDYPNWAEGWNARATMLFQVGRYAESLADIERVLALEPAHFGALTGRAHIFIRSGRLVEARRAIEAAMRHNPWVSERHLLKSLPAPEEI